MFTLVVLAVGAGQTAGRSSFALASQAGWVPSARMAFRELEALAGWLREQIAWEKKIASFVIFLIIVTPEERSRVTMEHTNSLDLLRGDISFSSRLEVCQTLFTDEANNEFRLGDDKLFESRCRAHL